MDLYPFKEIDIVVNNVKIKDQDSLLKEKLSDEKETYLPLFLPTNRLAFFYLTIPFFRRLYGNALAWIIKGETLSKAFEKELERMEKLVKKYDELKAGLYYSASSPLAFLTTVIYVIALGNLNINPDIQSKVLEIFKEYFGYLGEVEIQDNIAMYKHTSGFATPIIKSSDGIKEISYLVFVLEAFRDIPLFVGVDEIELHLYPRTLIDLLEYLLDVSRKTNNIFIFISHSLFVMEWAIKHILRGEQVNLYMLSKREDGYYELKIPDLSRPIKDFEELYLKILREHKELR